MRSPWGNVKIVKVKYKDGGGHVEVVGYIRKQYTRTHPYPSHITRIRPLPREKAAIKILNRKGYRTQEIAKFLGRSTSFVFRALRQGPENFNRFTHHFDDKRKMPHRTRLFGKGPRWNTLMKYWSLWEAWILGEGEKPP